MVGQRAGTQSHTEPQLVRRLKRSGATTSLRRYLLRSMRSVIEGILVGYRACTHSHVAELLRLLIRQLKRPRGREGPSSLISIIR